MKNLKSIRLAKNKTQEEISEFLGITRAAYTNIENDKREPDFQTLKQLAGYFDVSIDYLLDYDEKTTKKEAPSEMNTEEAIMLALSNMLGRKPTEEELKRFLVMTKAFFNVPDEQ